MIFTKIGVTERVSKLFSKVLGCGVSVGWDIAYDSVSVFCRTQAKRKSVAWKLSKMGVEAIPVGRYALVLKLTDEGEKILLSLMRGTGASELQGMVEKLPATEFWDKFIEVWLLEGEE